MKNDSFEQMWTEVKSSKPKLFFLIFLVIGGAAGIISNGLKLPGLTEQSIPYSYDQLMDEIYLAGLTTAQAAEKKSEFVGKRVSWQATVIDVEAGTWGNTVTLSDGPENSLTDYFLEGVSDSDALQLSKEDVINFSGNIDRIQDGVVTGYVYLTDVEIK
ncbi:hypothetical protein CLH62_14620 [Marinobacter guineae]|uniref:Uncharacterized protein n=1 Tax=Marinobacter guineae TaxID=432303 RepID=A0A2G1VBN5_9GAMM|nr:hypothetical protein [Marinobacter guineae]PHQ24165.1 hypothetical protein CLH62_14620 [Marinobacter guineae]